MFTGIIEGIGVVTGIRPRQEGVELEIRPEFVLHDPRIGESIAINGVCLTATRITTTSFSADVSPETLSRSNLGSLKKGDTVNIERALLPTDRLGGHFVSGHIDCTGEITGKHRTGAFTLVTIAIPPSYGKYIIEKGSITVDGMSLTVNQVSNDKAGCVFSVAVIPHTASVTTMGKRAPGDTVNIEVDLLGKYIEKLLDAGRDAPAREKPISLDFLRKHGYS